MLNATNSILAFSFSLRSRLLIVLALAFAGLWLAGCDNMVEQPKLDEPYMRSPVFGRAARDLEPGAVPVGFEQADEHFYNGTVDGELATRLPMSLSAEMLQRGQEQYQIFCAPCHGVDGYGDGIISQEGFPQPASYHVERLRNMPIGHFYQVITQGQNTMYSYASRIKPEDRWAIAAYIRVLQFSQNASFDELPADMQAAFETLDG